MSYERSSSAEVEREAAEERSRLAETARALKRKLSIGSIIDEIVGAGSRHGAQIGRTVGHTVRKHPVPMTLIGAGLVWLLVSGTRSEGERRSHLRQDPQGLPDDDESSDHGLRARAEAAAESVKAAGRSAASSVAEGGARVKEAARDGAEAIGERAEALGDRASEYGSEAWSEGKRVARRAGSSLGRLVEEQPLVVGALAFALGAAIGGAIRNSRAENRLMGSSAERMRQDVKERAKEEGQKLKDVARAAAAEARHVAEDYAESVERHVPEGRDLADKAEAEAKSAARRVAEAAESEAERTKLGQSTKKGDAGKSGSS